MFISEMEFNEHPEEYLTVAETEDIFIISNPGVKVKLVSAISDRLEAMESLFGSISVNTTFEEARQERLGNI